MFWLLGTSVTTGTMYFTGHGNLGSVFGINTYPVIKFFDGIDTIIFNANVNVPLEKGEKVSVRYHKSNPSDAKLNMFSCVWGDTLAYDLTPILMLLVVFFHPDLVPRNAKFLIGKKPWIRMINE